MKDFGLVLNGLLRKKLRSALLIVAIFIAFLIYGVLASFEASLNVGADLASDNRLIVTNKINFTQPLPIAYVERVKAIPGVDVVSYRQWFGGYFQEQREKFFAVFAIDPESYLEIYDEYVVSEEERAAFLEDQSSLMVGRATADYFGWKVGDQIPLQTDIWSRANGSRSWPFTIRAIYDGVETQTNTDTVFMHFDYLNEGRTFSKDFIGNVIVRTVSPSVNERVIEAIDGQFANSPFETRTATEAAFQAAFISQIGNIGLILASVTGAAFATMLLIVGNAMAGAIRERTKEIAVLKTLGFTGLRVGRIVFLETLILAAVGGGLGLFLAAGIATGLSEDPSFPGKPVLTPTIALTGMGYVLLLAILTALVPVVMAFRLSIITALGRE